MLQGFFVFFIFVVKRNVYHECQKKFGTHKRTKSQAGLIVMKTRSQKANISTGSNTKNTGVSFNSESSVGETNPIGTNRYQAHYKAGKESTTESTASASIITKPFA